MPDKLYIYGSSQFAIQLYRLVKNSPSALDKDYHFEGFIDDFNKDKKDVIDNFSVCGGKEFLIEQASKSNTAVLLGIGYNHLKEKYQLFEELRETKVNFPNFIHPGASIEKDASLGQGNIILGTSFIDVNCKIGDLNFIDAGCTITHDFQLGDNNYISLATAIGGGVAIGCHNFIGQGSNIIDQVAIGNHNMINAGSFITRKITDSKKYITMAENKVFSI